MKRWITIMVGLLVIGLTGLWPSTGSSAPAKRGWITLFDGSSLDNWSPIGNANWKLADGVVQADSGNGFLVSKNSYGDYQIRAEFWVDDAANSGVFIRCSDPTKVTAVSAYEVNIFDQRPDPSYGTGAIVNVAKPTKVLKAGGHWNTYLITAQGSRFTVVLNGIKTVDRAQDARHARGWVALQYAAGVVKFRKVEIRPL